MYGKPLVEWCKENSRQDILSEWDVQLNAGIDINEVSYGSIKKYWWKCDKGHKWQATPNSRTGKSKCGCAVCAGKFIVAGVNDLETEFPLIAEKWNYEKNYPLTPSQIAPKSNKKYWWKCNRGHEFESVTFCLIENVDCCPYCSNNKVLKGYNDFATTNPELLKEWDYSRNTIDPTTITYGNNNKVWWICSKGHSFEAVVSSRAGKQKTSCPYCAHQKPIVGENDLATTNPGLLIEWDYEKNAINPQDVFLKSNKKIWWLCNKGHSYAALISDRASGKGCPICANRKVLIGYNDLQTTNPKLALEWHPTRNGNLTPQDFTAGSDKKIWWQCARGHEWEAIISSRSVGRNCPHCIAETQTSLPEKAILFYIKNIFLIQ